MDKIKIMIIEIVIHNEGVIERKATDENEVEIVDEMIATGKPGGR